MDFDLQLDAKTIADASSSSERGLRTPTDVDNPTFKQGKEAGLGTWSEAFVVKDTSIGPPKNGGNNPVIKVVLETLGKADGGFDFNAGVTEYAVFYIDREALADKGHRLHRMNLQRVASVQSLFTSCGFTLPTEGTLSFKSLLNDDKPLVGQKVAGVVRRYSYTNKTTGEVVRTLDFDAFIPLTS